MRSGLIVGKLPNLLISPEYLEEAVKTHNSGAGYALAKDGAVIHSYFDPAETDLLKALAAIQENYKGEQVFFHLLKADEGEVDYESLQPFSILKKGEDQTLLAVMAEGEFINFAKAGPSFPEYHMVEEYLKAKITDIYKDAGNLDKTLTKLDSPGVRGDLLPHLQPRGTLLFIPARGKPFAHSINNLRGEYPWGFATKTLGIAPPKEEKQPISVPKTSTVARPLTLKEQRDRKAALAGGVPTPESAPTPAPTPKPIASTTPLKQPTPKVKEPPLPTGVKSNSPFFMKDSKLWAKPMAGEGWKAARKFWKRNTKLPIPRAAEDVYAGFPQTALMPSSPLYDFVDKADRPEEANVFRDGLEKARLNREARAKTTVDDQVNGVLTADEKKNIVEARKNTTLWSLTPEQLADQSKSIPKFTEQVAITYQDLLHSSVKFLYPRSKRELIHIIQEMKMRQILGNKVVDAAPATTEAPAASPAPAAAAPNRKLTLKEQRELKQKAAA